MFEKAIKSKFRYKSAKGSLTTEDLYDLNLAALDQIAITLDNDITLQDGKSFIGAKTNENVESTLKLEIVKHVIADKLAQKEAREQEATKRQKRAEILDLISKKQSEALGAKSVDELVAELNALDA